MACQHIDMHAFLGTENPTLTAYLAFKLKGASVSLGRDTVGLPLDVVTLLTILASRYKQRAGSRETLIRAIPSLAPVTESMQLIGPSKVEDYLFQVLGTDPCMRQPTRLYRKVG